MAMRPAAGLYGKIPAYGDFLNRQLPSSFVEPWNAWLDQGLKASKALLEGAWMEAYLTCPPWRFVIEPGLLGAEGWLGVMTSSVDRVHRCYPITVAIALGDDIRIALLTTAIDSVFNALETITLQLIDGSWTPEAVMVGLDALARTASDSMKSVDIADRGAPERLMVGAPHAAIAGLALRWGLEADQRQDMEDRLSGWWHRSWTDRPAAGLVTPGLPTPDLFTSFVDGNWAGRGWSRRDASR